MSESYDCYLIAAVYCILVTEVSLLRSSHCHTCDLVFCDHQRSYSLFVPGFMFFSNFFNCQ